MRAQKAVTQTVIQTPTRDMTVSHYVYIVECSDGTLYTGYTTDVERRIREHNSGKGAKYTRGRTPVGLVHTEQYETRSEAMSRESEIKSMSREKKESLL